MKVIKKNPLREGSMIFYFIGMLCYVVSMFFRDSLNDFWSGFLMGVAIAGLFSGTIHMVRAARRPESVDMEETYDEIATTDKKSTIDKKDK